MRIHKTKSKEEYEGKASPEFKEDKRVPRDYSKFSYESAITDEQDF
jgi:hypothetical protein